MFVDYHMHTPLCGHAQGEMEEYVEEAIRQGLKEIAFPTICPSSICPRTILGTAVMLCGWRSSPATARLS